VTKKLNRRDFVKTTALISAAASLLAGRNSGAVDIEQPFTHSAAAHLGHGATPYGQRSKFETAVRTLYPKQGYSVWSNSPLQNTLGIVTPSGLHFERHHAGVPDLDPKEHRLLIHGLVRRPLVFRVDEIMRLPAISRLHFIECSGNTFSEWEGPTASTVQ
jgi:DMSO/TMAO reductase YedYZ molybdopterin-dependent catalytic subunit